MSNTFDAVVVGAGPVGLFGALRLAQSGISVLLLEANDTLASESKASTFHPATLALLDDVGAAERLIETGVVVQEVQWRDLSKGIQARAPFSVLKDVTPYPFRLHAEQTLLTPILLSLLQDFSNAEVRFSSRVTSLHNLGDTTDVEILTDGNHSTVHTQFVLAADGAHSQIRKQTGVAFPGHSYDSRALRVVTRDDLGAVFPDVAGITYVRDMRQSCSLLKMRDHWRIIFRVAGAESDDAILEAEAVRALVDQVAPGINVDFAEVYSNRAHVADRYTVERTAFVGDAAHVTTTAGGMNMNCGIHDAYAMADAIVDVLHGGPLTEFEAAGECRRAVVKDVIIPRTEARAAGSDGNSAALEATLGRVRELAGDPGQIFQFLYEASMLDTSPSNKGR